MDFGVLESELHAVERVSSEGRGQQAQFIPIRFTFANKLYWDDKLLLAFGALVLLEMLCCDVSCGKIVHGDDHATQTVKTSALAGKVRKLIPKIAALLASHSPPDLVLNRHCVECEFRDRCRQKAIEQDDLSLLWNMTEKERRKFNSKGIFTFRARRRPKRLAGKREKYEPEAWSQFVIPSETSQRTEMIHTSTRLERLADVPIGGIMVALPALNKSGLWTHVEQLFPKPIDKRFQEIVLTFTAVLHLSRFPSIEALQFISPAEWRKVFCQERLPANRTLGEIICLIGRNAGRVAAWKAALAERWIKETPYFDEASFTDETSLEFMADRFQKYQRDNVTLDRLCGDIADLTRATLEPGRWPINVRECSRADSTCKLAGKTHSVAIGHAQGGEFVKRVDDNRLTRASCVDSGTTEFLSTMKLIAFRAENIMIRILPVLSNV